LRDVFVVIPAFNENSILRSTASAVASLGYSVVVVDDGSAIPVRECLRGLDVHFLRHILNLGQGAALQTGTEFALSRGARLIVHFDADGQHSPASIERLIEPILAGTFDVTLGSRFLYAADRREVPPGKRLMLKAGVFVSWLFTGVWLSDTHNGFRALSRGAAEQMELKERRFAHATEILGLLRRARLRYTEIPVTVRYTPYSRAKGQSMLNGFNIVIDLMLRKIFK
jgi:glycosyltransferase involved in cell wall biosynthesis